MLLDNREHFPGIHEVQSPRLQTIIPNGTPCFLKLVENCILLKFIAIETNFYAAEISHGHYKLCLQRF